MRLGAAILAGAVLLAGSGCDFGRDDEPDRLTRIVLEPASSGTAKELDASVEILRDRLDKLGVEHSSVERDGERIVAIVPTDADRALALLPRRGRLEFFDLQGDLVPEVSLDAQGFPIPKSKPPKLRPNTVVVTCRPPVAYCPGVQAQPAAPSYYLFRDDPDLTGHDLELKGTRQDFDGNGPVVVIQFTDEGAKKFQKITRTLAERGRLVANRNGWSGPENDVANQQFAIVLDRELKSAPSIDFDENPGGIPGDDGAQITGIGSLEEVRELALVLRVGTLPLDFRVVSKEERRP